MYQGNRQEQEEQKKLEKSLKNLLTKSRFYGTIRESKGKANTKAANERRQKKFEKPLDKQLNRWYNQRVERTRKSP